MKRNEAPESEVRTLLRRAAAAAGADGEGTGVWSNLCVFQVDAGGICYDAGCQHRPPPVGPSELSIKQLVSYLGGGAGGGLNSDHWYYVIEQAFPRRGDDIESPNAERALASEPAFAAFW